MEDDDRCGRMATTVTLENVSRVESLIKKSPKMTYAVIQDIMKISSGSIVCILHDCLGVRKCCAPWVPHYLSEEQKRGRVDWCTHMLRKFDGGKSPRVWNTVTEDKTWVYQYDPETKQQSAVWASNLRTTCEIPKKQKCFQTNDNMFLCKLRPHCHHTA